MENFNDVSDAFDGSLQVVYATRPGGGYVDGRWVSDAGKELTFSGVVQNAVPADLKVLKGGQRVEEAIKIHTTFEVKINDIILYNNNNWLVRNVAPRHIGGYHKAIAIRQ